MKSQQKLRVCSLTEETESTQRNTYNNHIQRWTDCFHKRGEHLHTLRDTPASTSWILWYEKEKETLHVPVTVRANSALITLTRVYNVSADPTASPLHQPKNAQHRAVDQPLNQLCPVRKALCTCLSTLCSKSHNCSLTLITACWAKPRWFLLSFLSFEAPLERCRLCTGWAERADMKACSPLRAAQIVRNSLFEHNVQNMQHHGGDPFR